MNLSELIAKYGDDKVTFQKLDDCATDLDMNKRGTRITFVTPERIGLNGTDKMGLIVWLDRKQVASIIADAALARPEGRLVPHHGSGPDDQ